MNDSFGPPDLPPQRQPQMPQFPELPKLPFSPKLLLFVPLVLVLLIGVWSSFYTVEAEEVGVVTRFGKFQSTHDPGLRFKLPFGIDRVQKVAVERQQKQEFGFGTQGASNPSQFRKSAPEQQAEKQMVTGDLNAALIEWVVQYRIQNPTEYLFNVRNPDETLRDASESIMREAVGDRTVDEVLTVGRQAIEAEVLLKLQELVNRYEMGLRINQVQLKNVDPPRDVQSSFNEVNNAQQQREELINKANGEYNREVPKARGEADRSISDAEGYAIQRVNEAEGDAARFNALYAEFTKAPTITRQRLYLETMAKVVPALGNKIILDEDAKQLLPLLNLDRTPTPR
ncbi:HflK protein [Haloferula helveola]|uniref:Protein HflK n=1 Tax=Haloferula helveola TaxID=490095 RepID=A0ABN6HA43_9BACT|nr:HflK protein [Haloferula helveola]